MLWTNIHLRVTKKNRKAQTNLLRDWLSRTAGCPLTFCLASHLDARQYENSMKKVFTMLASVSTQWKDIEFFLPDSQVCFDAISTAEKSLPLLTAATVHFSSRERQFSLFSVASQLSTLCINDIRLDRVLAPWHQLMDFTSRHTQMQEVREFLQKAPNIIRCTLKCDAPTWDETIQVSGSVKLPFLHEVYLHGDFASLSQNILPEIMTSFCSSHLLKNSP